EMVFAALVGGLLGARGYWLLGHTSELSSDPLGSIFGGSGLVWYGGALGGAAGVLLWAWRKGMFNVLLLDLCAPALAMGYADGRLAARRRRTGAGAGLAPGGSNLASRAERLQRRPPRATGAGRRPDRGRGRVQRDRRQRDRRPRRDVQLRAGEQAQRAGARAQ